MTKRYVSRTLFSVFTILGLVLAAAFAAKMAPHFSAVAGTKFEDIAKDLYLYLKEMAPVFITIVAAYLVSVFRKRSNFIESLEEEWRNIVSTKAALWVYFERPYPTSDDFISTYAQLSKTIDTMRIVYRNVGETKDLLGFYPYEPLHDMRRLLQDHDPRIKTAITAIERQRAQACIEQLFGALRENFLEELDLKEPSRPLLLVGARRIKQSGGAKAAKRIADLQRVHWTRHPPANTEIDVYLAALHAEASTKKPV